VLSRAGSIIGAEFPAEFQSSMWESDMRTIIGMTMMCVAVATMGQNVMAADVATETAATPLDQEMKTLDGKKVNLAEKYQGKVVLLVNVASKCGLTKQYKELEALHEKYSTQGLAIVGVPCNQFNGQEPGTAKEIAEFCKTNYGVEFDLLAKVDVNGPDAAPLYKQLTSKETAKFPGDISWNFEKFLFNRKGQPVARFAPRVTPDAPEVVKAIETELADRS